MHIYCRWALGVPNMANSLRVISECGLTPFRHVAAAARAKYFFLLQSRSRPSDHLTTRALLHVTSPNKLNVYSIQAHYYHRAPPECCTNSRDSLLPPNVNVGSEVSSLLTVCLPILNMHVFIFITKIRSIIVLENVVKMTQRGTLY